MLRDSEESGMKTVVTVSRAGHTKQHAIALVDKGAAAITIATAFSIPVDAKFNFDCESSFGNLARVENRQLNFLKNIARAPAPLPIS